MSLGKTWYTLEDAASKYCLETSSILNWVEQGVVRAEHDGKQISMVNIDDIDLKVQEMTGL